MTQSRDVLARQAAWSGAVAAGRVTGWTEDGIVTVVTDGPVAVPLTAPDGTRDRGAEGARFGEPYAGARSAWVQTDGERRFTLPSPEDA
jgi:hypothetical protein